ncbi:hypothetical protein MHU86_6496 [Fragilaria crotonensis]|nr:hypothetical protein MHU86_6496 [Fragilaria crotonensis]
MLRRRLLAFAAGIACVSSLSATLPSNTGSTSIGEAIQHASSQEELLCVAKQLWLPTDPDLPHHLQSQRIHHEKRQRWSAQLLEKLGNSALSSCLHDDRLRRAIRSASIPFSDPDRPDKEGRYVRQALCAMHALVGKLSFSCNNHDTEDFDEVLHGIHQLVERAEAMADKMPLPHVIEMRFASRGLLARFGKNLQLPTMDRRVRNLPFDIIPNGLNWEQIVPDTDPVHTLLRDIPFRFDTITTRTGAVVVERRGTAWVAEPGIGALAYSGKLMPPQSMPLVVQAAMRQAEAAMGMDTAVPYFDCALCNHYPDDDAACKFHTDPEHGTFWERLTCVVAAGDCRRFAFRPIPGENKWTRWDAARPIVEDNASLEENTPAAIHLFSGDLVLMWGECNDVFHHAVYTAEGESAATSPDGRVSLVFKRAIDRGNGRRGHGLQGEGRRARRKTIPMGSEPQTKPQRKTSMRRKP